MNIATINVNSLNMNAKLDHIRLQAKKLRIDILGMSDIRKIAQRSVFRIIGKTLAKQFSFSLGSSHRGGTGILIFNEDIQIVNEYHKD